MAENLKSSPSAGLRPKKFEPFFFSLLSQILFFLCPLALGQEEQAVSVKIHFVAWGDAIDGLSLKSGNETSTFRAESFVYSPSLPYRGSEIVEIFQISGQTEAPNDEGADPNAPPLQKKKKMTPDPSAESKAAPKSAIAQELAKRRVKDPTLVSLARIPRGCTRATILLQALGNGTFQSYVINDDPSQLPLGILRLHNLSAYPVKISLMNKNQTIQLKPNQQATLPADKESVIYELSYLQGKEWIYQENNIVRVSQNEQTQMLILRSENDFFVSSGGSVGGFLQHVVLRRSP